MVRVVKPGGRVVILEITTPQKPPLSTFFSLWFDRIVPLMGRFDEAYTYLPNSVKRFPGPEPLAAELAAAGCARRRLDPHRRRDHRPAPRDRGVADGQRRGGRRGRRGGRRARPRVDARRSRSGWPRSPARTARRSASTRARRSPRAASGCGRCWCSSPRGRLPRGATPRCARRSRWSSCTPRRWSTTTCSTPPCCAAAARRWSPSAGRSIATATGDLLFSRAFAELAGGGSVEPVRVLSDASSALVQGELLQREDAWKLQTTRERYLRRCDLKTARLFRAACELGALAGGGNVALLGEFGERIGLAFQLLDDVLDVSGPGGADRQAPRHRPARRHGHAAADPRARARSGAGGARPARGADTGAGRGRVRRDRGDGRAGSGPRGGAGDGRRGEGGPAAPAGTVAAGRAGAGGRRRRRPLHELRATRSLRGGSRWRRGRRRSARLRPPCSPARGGGGP